MSDLILPLGELDRLALDVAGGKAANLGELIRAGFAVPQGYCVTTLAYKRFAAALGDRLDALLDRLDSADSGELATQAEEIRALFLSAAISPDLQQELRATIDLARDTAWAVRSSATAEDLPEASFAGQQETFLNVAGEAALLDAIRQCWASLWTDRAIVYRARNGIAHKSVALAVVMQQMVGAAAAGVLFTANPLTGKRSEISIEASFGLGVAVVSGLVTPDNHIVDKRSWQIVSRRIAIKAKQVTGLTGGGTAEVAVGAAERDRPALEDRYIVELARTGAAIEAHFGRPQDVEWALADGKLWVLQSRPITSMYPAPPLTDELRVFLSVNSVQGMVEPFTPLGASVFLNLAKTAFGEGPPGRPRLVPLGWRLFLDITQLLRNRLGRRFPAQVLPMVDPVAAHIVRDLAKHAQLAETGPSERAIILNVLRQHWRTILPMALTMVRFLANPSGTRRRVEAKVARQLGEAREAFRRPRRLGEQISLVADCVDLALSKVLVPKLIPMVASGMVCLKVAERLVGRFGLDQGLLVRARQGLPHNKTTEMNLELWALAKALRADAPSKQAFERAEPNRLVAQYRSGQLPQVAQCRVSEFLDKYGHRAIREIDVGMPRWAEDPSYVFGLLHSYVSADFGQPEAAPDRHFAAQAIAGDQAAEELVRQARRMPGGWLKAAVLGFLLWRYRRLGGLREMPKFYIVWVFQALRDALLAAGEQMVGLGLLERPQDVCFLRIEEIGAEHDAGHFRSLVADRQREYRRELDRRRAPRVITSEGEAFYGAALVSAEGGLAGMPASPGVAHGRARVIFDPVGAHLERGEILVSPSTDPAWTPLFLVAGGLVMEAGGTMSHGAIVAREYGIPAVVGVVEATTRIATGAEVEVDGDRGIVVPALSTAKG